MLRSFNNILFVNTISRLVHASLVFYPSPAHLTYSFSFGFLSGLFLVIQIVTGVLLTMFYVPHVLLAFDSIQFVMREVNYGFILRYMHLSGASFFFLVIYIHMAKALFFSSFSTPRRSVWIVGVLIFFILMGTAFLGYVLVWGQMSFWAATVITNLLTVIPLVGNNLTSWIWGGFAINESTLTRFFSIHFLLPFVIALLSIYHLFLLHQTHSSNPLGSFTPKHLLIRFYPFFYIKDLLVALCILSVYFFVVCFYPEMLNHPDNYVPADALKTPASIVPEIYFLPFYGLLKSILNKSMGIAAMFASIFVLFVLPTRSPDAFKNFNNQSFHGLFYFICNFILLGVVGEKTPTTFLLSIGQLCSHLYFIYLLVLYREEDAIARVDFLAVGDGPSKVPGYLSDEMDSALNEFLVELPSSCAMYLKMIARYDFKIPVDLSRPQDRDLADYLLDHLCKTFNQRNVKQVFIDDVRFFPFLLTLLIPQVVADVFWAYKNKFTEQLIRALVYIQLKVSTFIDFLKKKLL